LTAELAAEQKEKEEKARAAEERFRKACKEVLAEVTLNLDDSDMLKVLADGKVTPEGKNQLKSLAKFLKIPNETIKQILAHQAKLYQKAHSPKATD